MRQRRIWNFLFCFFLLLIAVTFLPKLVLADSPLYSDILTLRVILLIGSPTKLLFLAVATAMGWRCYMAFERGNPVRPAWLLMALGTGCFFLGQSVLAWYQIIRYPAPTPYPSLGDPLFLAGSGCFILALGNFIRAYGRAGLPIGSRLSVATVIAVLGLILSGLAVGVLLPIWSGAEWTTGTLLDTAYVFLDFVLLIPGLLLVRTVFMLRGGLLWRVWVSLVVGFVCLAAGDIFAAYFSLTGNELLDPILDLLFAYGYIFIALGTRQQALLLE